VEARSAGLNRAKVPGETLNYAVQGEKGAKPPLALEESAELEDLMRATVQRTFQTVEGKADIVPV
jgi:hypothetical protein